jgi:hypothetical protein
VGRTYRHLWAKQDERFDSITDATIADVRTIPKLVAGLVFGLALAAPAFGLDTFTDEAKAQQHCPKNIVVWLNLPTMIWHWKGQRWYANTIHGAFACKEEAAAAGARGTRNGQ